jgi:hypothetical protein
MSSIESIQNLFNPDIIKTLNKLYRLPKWANDKARANTDKSLMVAKVRKYVKEIGNHIGNNIPAERQDNAWIFVAERSSSKLNAECLKQLYSDIIDEEGETKK